MRAAEESGVKQTANSLERAKIVEAAKGEEKETLLLELKKAQAFLETFRNFRESPPVKKKEVEKLVKRITPILECMKPDASLRHSWAATAMKGLEERNDFDEMTLSAVEQLFKKDIDTKEERMTRHAEKVAALEAKTQNARQAAEVAIQRATQANANLTKAEGEREACKALVAQAQQKLRDHEKQAKQIA